jgi:large subunit ribosomal protein L25
MSEYTLALEARELTGKKLGSLRAKGIVPGVIYGNGKEPVLVQSEYVATDKALRAAGYSSPIDLTVGSEKQMALLKNVDIDPVKRTIRNVEFLAVSAHEVVEATAPIVIVGYETSEAQMHKLSLMQVLEEIDVKAKPTDLPKQLEVDGSALVDVDSKLTLADVKLPAGVEFVDKELVLDEQAVAVVMDPEAEAAAREAEDAAATTVDAAEVPAENGAPAAEATEATTENKD